MELSILISIVILICTLSTIGNLYILSSIIKEVYKDKKIKRKKQKSKKRKNK